MSAPDSPKHESSLGEAVAKRPEGRPSGAERAISSRACRLALAGLECGVARWLSCSLPVPGVGPRRAGGFTPFHM